MKTKLTRVFLVTLVAVGAGAAWYLTRPVPRSIARIIPIGPDEAVLLTQDHIHGPRRASVEAVGVDGTVRWQHDLEQRATILGRRARTVVADTTNVYLMVHGPDGVGILALGRDDGAEKWHTLVGPGAPFTVSGATLELDGDRLIAVHPVYRGSGQAEGVSYTALSPVGGATLWTRSGADDGYDDLMLTTGTLIGPGSFVVTRAKPNRAETKWEISNIEIDTTTGKVRRRLPPSRGSCVTRRGVVAGDGAEVAFFPLTDKALGDPQAVDLNRPRGHFALKGPCGTYGDRVIFGFADKVSDDSPAIKPVLSALDANTGVVAWSISFEGQTMFEFTAAGPWDLPRYFPIVTSSHEGPAVEMWVHIVDLQTGTIASKTLAENYPKVYATVKRSLLYDYNTARLMGYDAETGASVSAILGAVTLYDELSVHDIREGRLWHFRRAAPTTGDLPWSVIDLASWKVLHKNGDSASD